MDPLPARPLHNLPKLAVQAHDAGSDVSHTYTTSYKTGCGPLNISAPRVAGSPDISSFVAPQLVATTGSWSGSPSSYTLQWEDCNSSGVGCISGQGAAYGPGASGSACTITAALYGCSYNLTASEFNACPEAGGSGACVIKLVVTASNGTGSTAVTVSVGTVTDGDASDPWPNYSNTGYQNTPALSQYGTESYAAATGGTEGVPNSSLLTVASSSSSTCPTTIQSNHTYAFCWYKDTCPMGSSCNGLTVGSSGHAVSNVHFVGDLFESENGSPSCGGTYCDIQAITLYCSSDCTFDYDTVKPADLSVPDLPMPGHGLTYHGYSIGHGTTYSKGYGEVCDCGSGTVGNGFTFDHSDMWGWGSGIVVGTNSSSTPNLIQDNWLHDQAACERDSSCTEHTDGIGMVNSNSSTSYVTLNHNNMPMIQDNTNDVAFQQGTYNNLAVTNNVLSGDGFTLAIWGTSSNVTFTGNLWTNYAQQDFGVTYLAQSFWGTPGSTWAHNKFKWDPTGVRPYYQWGPDESGNPYDSVPSSDSGMCWIPPTKNQNSLSTTDYGGRKC